MRCLHPLLTKSGLMGCLIFGGTLLLDTPASLGADRQIPVPAVSLADAALASQVKETIKARLPHLQSTVEVASPGAGKIILAGTVPSTNDRANAANIARGVSGVSSVDNRLRVREMIGTREKEIPRFKEKIEEQSDSSMLDRVGGWMTGRDGGVAQTLAPVVQRISPSSYTRTLGQPPAVVDIQLTFSGGLPTRARYNIDDGLRTAWLDATQLATNGNVAVVRIPYGPFQQASKQVHIKLSNEVGESIGTIQVTPGYAAGPPPKAGALSQPPNPGGAQEKSTSIPAPAGIPKGPR